MLRVLIFIVMVINLGCNKKGDLSISENSHADTSVSSTDFLPRKDSIINDSLTGEIYPVILAPSMKGIGVVSIQFSKAGSTKILDRENNVFVHLNFSEGEITLQDKTYSFSEVSNQTLEQAHNFSPRITALEYEILLFDCLSKSEQFYEIIINEKNGIPGKIPISDSNTVFQTWEELLLKSYISFDPKSNPLRTDPEDQSKIVYPYNDYFFKVIEVRNNWIKVQCDDDCKECEKGDLTGWIKWKDGNNFLIQIGLIC